MRCPRFRAPCWLAALALTVAGLAAPAGAQPAGLPGIDLDGDGQLTRLEYRRGLVSESLKFDRNRDGRLSLDELPGFTRVPGVRRVVERVFAANDRSGDGALSGEELAARADVRFTELDRNGDGALDAAEIKGGRGRR